MDKKFPYLMQTINPPRERNTRMTADSSLETMQTRKMTQKEKKLSNEFLTQRKDLSKSKGDIKTVKDTKRWHNLFSACLP